MTDKAQLVLRSAVGSDHGLRRELNEDSAYASARLLAVADGMGGHAYGEVASALAIAAVSETAAEAADSQAALFDVVRDAARRLEGACEEDPDLSGMGTTLTAVYWDDERLAVAHIGDSRAYLVRDNALTQITHDHTLVQSLVDAGRLSEEEADRFPNRAMLVRALRTTASGEPDVFPHDAQPGDRFLLCSDGLTDVVSTEAIAEVLIGTQDRDQAVQQLIDLAREGGGPDNITCIVADLVPEEPQEGVVIVGAALDQARRASGNGIQRWLRRLRDLVLGQAD